MTELAKRGLLGHLGSGGFGGGCVNFEGYIHIH